MTRKKKRQAFFSLDIEKTGHMHKPVFGKLSFWLVTKHRFMHVTQYANDLAADKV